MDLSIKFIYRHFCISSSPVFLIALAAAAAHGGDSQLALGPFPKALAEEARVTDVRELVSVIELTGDYARGKVDPRRVVDALRRFVFPNWTFSGPLTATPEAPRDGERVRLEAVVVNDGNAPTPAGVLRFYEGDPREGPVTLAAVVDPDGAVEELSEADNRAALAVTVAPAPAAADLAVTPGDVAVDPPQPAALPVDLAVSAVVRNFGLTGAAGVRVVLWHGDAGTGAVAGERTLDLPARSSAVANFVFSLTAPGATRLTGAGRGQV